MLIQKSFSQDYICFYTRMTYKMAQVEAQEIKDSWLVTRLIVPPSMRQQGIASQLMQTMCSWADEGKHKLVLTINPYGDLSREQLQVFVKKFGFREKDCTGLFVRDPSICT